MEIKTLKIVEKKLDRFIFRHTGKFKMRWDLFIILFVLWNALEIPFEIGFLPDDVPPEINAFGYFVDFLFFLDILVTFRTTIDNEKTGMEITEGKVIAKLYVLHWRFYFDVLSILPFEEVYGLFSEEGSSTNNITFKIFNCLKLIRLLRLGRIITYMKLKSDVKTGMRIIQLVGLLFLMVHWFGCILQLIVQSDPS
jgi:hypothetical protein